MFATMGCFMNGGVIGYSGPANPSVMDPLSTDMFGNSFFVDLQEVSWISKLDGIVCTYVYSNHDG